MDTVEITITALSFVLGALATGYKFWVKLKAAKTKGDVQKLAGAALSEALQLVKEDCPEIWEDIKPIIESECSRSPKVENTIREFRGLEPRDI